MLCQSEVAAVVVATVCVAVLKTVAATSAVTWTLVVIGMLFFLTQKSYKENQQQ